MRFQFLIFCTVLIFTVILTGCPGPSTPPNNTINSNNPTNAANNSNSNSPFNPTVKTPEATTNDAPTLKPTFTAYCDAKTKKDEAALRKVYSQATLKQFETEMKEENEKSLVKYLEVDQVSNKLCEIRNEKIDGDTGVAEVKTEGMPNGVKIKFVKENGDWKLTNEIPDMKSVIDSSKSSNTATTSANTASTEKSNKAVK